MILSSYGDKFGKGVTRLPSGRKFALENNADKVVIQRKKIEANYIDRQQL